MTNDSSESLHMPDGVYFDLVAEKIVVPALTLLHQSTYTAPSEAALRVMRDGIIDQHETPADMISRVAANLYAQEQRYDLDPALAQELADEFIGLCDQRKIVMGSPILTNAGRHTDRPLSACAVIPADFDKEPELALEYMHKYHEAGIGLGIDLHKYPDPVATARRINEEVLKADKAGRHERHIGNMGTVKIYHPKIREFIRVKLDTLNSNYDWRFNFSVDCDAAFMEAVKQDKNIQLDDGTTINAKSLMIEIAASAALTGDPGLLFLDRLNERNPVPAVGLVKNVPPCAEMGLIEGEACQFAYLNIGEFVQGKDIDIDGLKRATFLLTRALDNALDISIDNISHPLGADVMSKKRKIGIGICGLADMLAKLDLPYNSPEGRETARDILTLINYTSKVASVELAKKRGSATAMELYKKGEENLHYAEQAMLLKYARDTRYVTDKMWQDLVEEIKRTGLLRNTSTIALPPTGRTGILADASFGIEPWFTVLDMRQQVHPILKNKLIQAGLWSAELEAEIMHAKCIQKITTIPESIRRIFVTATEMSEDDHLLMTATLQECNDESASKTINFMEGAFIMDVYNSYMTAYDLDLNGITVYINKSRKNQPITLAS